MRNYRNGKYQVCLPKEPSEELRDKESGPGLLTVRVSSQLLVDGDDMCPGSDEVAVK